MISSNGGVKAEMTLYDTLPDEYEIFILILGPVIKKIVSSLLIIDSLNICYVGDPFIGALFLSSSKISLKEIL
jgi:hypothetical protein